MPGTARLEYPRVYFPTIKQEFYVMALRKKPYKSLEEMQLDLDQWMKCYIFEATHRGRHY